jgi:hypothetical protein
MHCCCNRFLRIAIMFDTLESRHDAICDAQGTNNVEYMTILPAGGHRILTWKPS